MLRPTTIQHPIATLRKAVDLGRDQMSARLKMSRPAHEKVEHGRNSFTTLLRERVFAATGVCHCWLAIQDGPIHSCDGVSLRSKSTFSMKDVVPANARSVGSPRCSDRHLWPEIGRSLPADVLSEAGSDSGSRRG